MSNRAACRSRVTLKFDDTELTAHYSQHMYLRLMSLRVPTLNCRTMAAFEKRTMPNLDDLRTLFDFVRDGNTTSSIPMNEIIPMLLRSIHTRKSYLCLAEHQGSTVPGVCLHLHYKDSERIWRAALGPSSAASIRGCFGCLATRRLT